ncbi:hypothetical protein NDU88_002655 [Pleurodeles waltl]|uniref:Secreted protein n=1 Tax=Pleurodeles waltl TaxID=8319 RepID=A0AAV7U9W1_PLEWA|nr:hypothetical protein NDU88_002655 [Pleurodeles waltl]
MLASSLHGSSACCVVFQLPLTGSGPGGMRQRHHHLRTWTQGLPETQPVGPHEVSGAWTENRHQRWTQEVGDSGATLN